MSTAPNSADNSAKNPCPDPPTVNGKFINGQQAGIEAIYKMTTEYEWERFLRFMNRYAESNGMSLSRPEA